MLDQARDSKSVQPLLLLDQFTGGALESPVKIVFVSGSTSDTFSSLTYVESTPVDAVNKTINSVLTGAFYDKP